MTATCKVRGCNRAPHIIHLRLCAMHLARYKRTGSTGSADTVMKGNTPRHSRRALAALKDIAKLSPGHSGEMRVAHKEKTTYTVRVRRIGEKTWRRRGDVAWQTLQGLVRRGWVRMANSAADGTRKITITKDGQRAMNAGAERFNP